MNYTSAIGKEDTTYPRIKQSLKMAKVGHCRKESQISGEKEGLSNMPKPSNPKPNVRRAGPKIDLHNKEHIFSLYGRGKGKQTKVFNPSEKTMGTNSGMKNERQPTFQHTAPKGNRGCSALLSDIKGSHTHVSHNCCTQQH